MKEVRIETDNVKGVSIPNNDVNRLFDDAISIADSADSIKEKCIKMVAIKKVIIKSIAKFVMDISRGFDKKDVSDGISECLAYVADAIGSKGFNTTIKIDFKEWSITIGFIDKPIKEGFGKFNIASLFNSLVGNIHIDKDCVYDSISFYICMLEKIKLDQEVCIERTVSTIKNESKI